MVRPSAVPSDRAPRLADLEHELRSMGARSVMLSHAIVHLVPDRARKIGKLFAPLAQAMAELSERYNDEELALMVDYTRRGNAITPDHIARVERGGTGRDRG